MPEPPIWSRIEPSIGQETVMRGRLSTLLFGVLLCTGPAQGQTPPPACTSEAHRQFDFWLGDWEVDGGTDGKTPVGKSSITRVAKGCAIHENWRSANGGDGHSLNALDPATGQWNQFWVGADGVILRLAGGIEDGAMVLGGTLDLANGKPQLQRVTWTPMADGRVSQRWETSDDDGKHWTTSFLGFYRNAK
ncbi:MAG: hypothetical protein IPO66_23585 [Rhodanobacteraceae bacterium]|nr:hypothetical protein [Rhodanobacteraceae bacterium]